MRHSISRVDHFHTAVDMHPDQVTETLAAANLARVALEAQSYAITGDVSNPKTCCDTVIQAFKHTEVYEYASGGERALAIGLIVSAVYEASKTRRQPSARVPLADLGIADSGTGIDIYSAGNTAQAPEAAEIIATLQTHFTLDPVAFEWGETNVHGAPLGGGAARCEGGQCPDLLEPRVGA